MLRGGRRVPALLVLAVGIFLLLAASATAAPRPTPHAPPPRLRTGTQLVWQGGLGPGLYNVAGFLPDLTNDFDPLAGYPAGNPASGFTPTTEYFAGVIQGTPTDGSPTVKLYCIDIRTDTYPGLGYGFGTWDEANVPNVGYVARILDEYYPAADLPALGDTNLTAAAVQAAIWYFSDGFVVNTSDPALHDAVAALVTHIIDAGPLPQPHPPSLTITPSHASGPAGGVLGPFTETTDAADATVTATGGSMFSNPAGTAPLPDPDTVPSGTKIWVRARGTSSVVLQATSKATVPSGNVYLYDGNTAGYTAAQKLVLAAPATLTTTVQATGEFLPSGSLVVRKRITGPAAGAEGRVVITVACDDGVRRRPFVIRAGTPAGIRSHTYRHILAGTRCTVTETSNGSTTATDVVVTGDGREATIPAGASDRVEITDFYQHVGSLLVRKTTAGPAAGHQGEVRIHSECDGTALTPDLVIPAGTPAGDHTRQYDHIPVPATCTVTETADGRTSTVSVIVQGSGQHVSIRPGEIAQANISDTYGLLPGQLAVTKSIVGPLAGHQGPVVIHTVCNGAALSPDFVIPAGTPAGVQSHIYSGVPTPATCSVTETSDGHTGSVSAATIGSPHTVTIPAAGAGAAHIIDTYGSSPGSLLVTKTIAGPRAGRHGPITMHVACNGTTLSPAFTIPAHRPAGSVSHSFDGIPAGSHCTVTESADGTTAAVTATVSGAEQTLTVPAGTVVPTNVMDTYQDSPGTLKVTKTITGPAAGRQGRIMIEAACGGSVNDFAFIIPPHTRAGSVSRYFDGIPAGSRCTITESADGHTGTVAAAGATRRRTVTIRAGGVVNARLGDTFISGVPVTG